MSVAVQPQRPQKMIQAMTVKMLQNEILPTNISPKTAVIAKTNVNAVPCAIWNSHKTRH